MKLSSLLTHLKLTSLPDIEISHITLDSRQVKPGALFLAMPGETVDGRLFLDKAIHAGASAVLVEAEGWRVKENDSVPVIPVKQLRPQVSRLASTFFDTPSSTLKMIGVTGTNGKSSICHYTANLLELLGERCGMIGTLGVGFLNALQANALTTPDPIQVQQHCHDLKQAKATAVAMEVSSHALAQDRVSAVNFDIGIFTNLSRDHLDYHQTMAQYGLEKSKLFTDFPLKSALLNAAEPYVLETLLPSIQKKNPKTDCFFYSHQPILHRPQQVQAMVAQSLSYHREGVTGVVDSCFGKGKFKAPILGNYNVDNCLAAMLVACYMGYPLSQVLDAVSHLKPVPGRMQVAYERNTPLVVIDYAHTPDALEQVLKGLRLLNPNQLWCVFGCGGDRDRGKRPLMAKAAEQGADKVILTQDNPRHESSKQIMSDILKGFSYPEQVAIIEARQDAIQQAIADANPEDIVLVAGKGHECVQIIGANKLPFDDTLEVTKALEERRLTCTL